MTDANPNKLLSGIVASAALEVERRLGGYLPQVGSGEGDWGIPPQGERLLRHAKQFEAGSFTSSNRLFSRDQRSPMERGLGGYLPQVGCPKLSRRLPRSAKRPEQAKECGASASPLEAGFGAPGGIRIPNLLIRRASERNIDHLLWTPLSQRIERLPHQPTATDAMERDRDSDQFRITADCQGACGSPRRALYTRSDAREFASRAIRSANVCATTFRLVSRIRRVPAAAGARVRCYGRRSGDGL
jgi:hypothetical protein